MSHLSDGQLDSLTMAAEFMSKSDNPGLGVVTLVAERIGDEVAASIFMDRPRESINLSVVYTFMESLLALAETADFCDCEPCCGYLAKMEAIRRIMRPN